MKFTIGKKIGTGFGVLIFFTILVFLSTKLTLDESRDINNENTQIHSPSVDELQELKIQLLESKMLITNWANVQSSDDSPEKQALRDLLNEQYPALKAQIEELSRNWSKEDKDLGNIVFEEVGVLFSLYDDIMLQLIDFESYENPEVKFIANMYVEKGGDIDNQSEEVLTHLDSLILKQRENTTRGSQEMISAFDDLEFMVKNIGLALFLGGFIIAFFTVRTIVKPVQKFKSLIGLLGRGIIPQEKMKPRNDEIGEMAVALNDLIAGFKRTTEFAKEVGSGNFESEYHPLSDNDSLGHSLIAMRKDLWGLTSNLEHKVKERTAEVVRQKGELEKQKHEIEELLREVTDSIHYAKRIQNAILPSETYCKRLIPQSFILFKPKDIVSGDFYWVNERNGKAIFAAIDCTGHGVPGALMTIVGYNSLNQAMLQTKSDEPAELLNGLNEGVIKTFTHESGHAEIKDGMDAAMCVVDVKKRKLQYAGAFNPLYIIRKDSQDVEEIKANKFPIGNFVGEEEQKFTNHEMDLNEGDTIYIFSDGYADQFGGPKGKKFRYKNFRDLLLSIQDKSMDEQQKILDDAIESWKGSLEQIDDILVIGIRV